MVKISRWGGKNEREVKPLWFAERYALGKEIIFLEVGMMFKYSNRAVKEFSLWLDVDNIIMVMVCFISSCDEAANSKEVHRYYSSQHSM